ncbi:MAG: sigma-70 family RNA polymerase sigma factor, partial [Planctomycetota bacterium]
MIQAVASHDPQSPSTLHRFSRFSGADGQVWEQTKRLMAADITYIPSETFERSYTGEAAQVDAILGSLEESSGSIPRNLPPHLAALCGYRLLDASEESLLFREMNFLKYRAARIRASVDPSDPHPDLVITALRALDRASLIRDSLIRTNIRLAVSIARRFSDSPCSFDELLSEAIFVLMYSVEKFDSGRGFRFSTYAYRAISRHLYRMVTETARQESRMTRDAEDWAFEETLVAGSSPPAERFWTQLRGNLNDFLQKLDRRERFVVRCRYALGNHRTVKT